jgi:hypothetical protein
MLPIGASTYHSLQLRFERRLAGGFAAQGAYTFSKSIDDDGNQDNLNRRLEKSISGFDVAHNLRYSFTWQLPAGVGRRWLNKGGLAEKVLGGWNVSTLSIVQSGAPLSMGTVSNLTGSLGGGSRPNRLRDGMLSGESRGLARWFDASAYALPDPFTFGNASRTEPRLRAPGSFNLSLLLAKAFQLAEHTSLHIRSEFFNALNHFNPGAPNTGIGSPAVGTIVGGSGGRTIQLSLKLYY